MKYFYITIFLLTFLSTSLTGLAQVRIGYTFGLNQAKATIKDKASNTSVSLKSILGLRAGVSMQVPASESFSLITGVFLNQKGFEFTDTGSGEDVEIKIHYLSLPILAQIGMSFRKNPRLFIDAGPVISIAASGRVKVDGQKGDLDFNSDHEGSIKRLDLGFTFGAGVEIDPIKIRLSYEAGLANISNSTEASLRNRVFSLTLAYQIERAF
ncbi:porin family protein [Rapidithrix thailandica]|uniref:Porin family protein n=1 Tax=Rapidithrix thailandica TaxID=413964 RepID=A0AAW9S650_9BACT